MARLHTGLALLRYQQPERAERRPGRGCHHIGRQSKSCGIRLGHKQRSCNPAATSRTPSGEVGGDEGKLWGTEVLSDERYGGITLYCHITVIKRMFFLINFIGKIVMYLCKKQIKNFSNNI